MLARKALADFDLNKDKWPNDFDEYYAKMPKEIDAEFDRAIAAANDNREEDLLDACHKIEAYFGFPKPNELVKSSRNEPVSYGLSSGEPVIFSRNAGSMATGVLPYSPLTREMNWLFLFE